MNLSTSSNVENGVLALGAGAGNQGISPLCYNWAGIVAFEIVNRNTGIGLSLCSGPLG
jgi:hypothetical protein